MRKKALSLCLLLLGCSGSSNTPEDPNPSTGGKGGASSTIANTGGGGEGGGLELPGSSSSSGGGKTAAEGEVFGHSNRVLYKLDPISKKVTEVGNFPGCALYDVLDIAIDKNGVMYAATFSALYRVERKTSACTFVTWGGFPNSMSFVPQGTVDPNEEALVGYRKGPYGKFDEYVRINTKDGVATKIGELGNGYESSGDVVSVIGKDGNNPTYLTVYGNGCDDNDCIVEIDPKTGAFVKLIGKLGHKSVYGLAFWGGKAYGFSDGGKLFQIDLQTAATTPIAFPFEVPGLSFWGAGSTTAAPLEEGAK